MKARAKLWAILAVLLALSVAPAAGAPGAEAEIRAVLKGLTRAYEAKDMGRLLEAAAPEVLVEVAGPLGLDRQAGRQRVRAAYEPELRAAQSPTLAFTHLEIEAGQTRALIRAEILAGAWLYQRRLNIPARLSARMEKRGGRWLVVSVQVRYPVLAGRLDGLAPWDD